MGGDLLAVITTDALELGIDIGALDAGMCVTFPGTVASLRQMWGRGRPPRPRAGGLRRRRGRAGPVLLPPSRRVPRPARRGGDPHHENEHDPPRAPAVRGARGAAARRATPRSSGRAGAPTPSCWSRRASSCERRGRFVLRRPEDYPAARVSLRSASPDSFAVVDVVAGEVLGTVETARRRTVHDGAVYLHLGRSYEVVELDVERHAARSSRRSTAPGTRSPRRRPRPGSSGCSTGARRWGSR